MRIGIDGFNLAMPQGTGVATYGASLASNLNAMGYEAIGVFGLDAGNKPEMSETLFHDQLGRGPLLGPVEVVAGVLQSLIVRPGTHRLTQVEWKGRVQGQSFRQLSGLTELWTSALLFEKAYARFRYFGRFLTIAMPNPPAIMHWTYPLPLRMAGARNVYTIHDLVPLKLPYATLDNKRYYYNLVRACVRQGDHICTVSDSSEADVIDWFPAAAGRVSNCYQSSPAPARITPETAAEDASIVRSVFGLPDRGFLLFFGAIDPKKNINRIIEAYLASEVQMPLVLVTGNDWGGGKFLKDTGSGLTIYNRHFGERIARLAHLPRETLFRLIRGARAVLFPSLYEGFGLPVLEAMQLGTPVVTSNTSSLPEVAGDAALSVDPYSVSAIAAAIRAVCVDDALHADLIARGLRQAAKFSDQAFQERLSTMYETVMAGGRRR